MKVCYLSLRAQKVPDGLIFSKYYGALWVSIQYRIETLVKRFSFMFSLLILSLLCVPGKLMESCVVSTITSHITDHGHSNKHQWAYKQGHSTELLLAKMSEDWRRALDNNHTVGIVFVDFRKAFDSISHPLLLKKLRG